MFWIRAVSIADVIVFWIIAGFWIRYWRSAKMLPKEEKPDVIVPVFVMLVLPLFIVFYAFLGQVQTDVSNKDLLNLIAGLVVIQLIVVLLAINTLTWVRQEINERRWIGWELSYDAVRLIDRQEFSVKTRPYDRTHYVGGLRVRHLYGWNPKTGLRLSVQAEITPTTRYREESSEETPYKLYDQLVKSTENELEAHLNGIARSICAINTLELSDDDTRRASELLKEFQPEQLLCVRIKFAKNTPKMWFENPAPVVISL